MRARLVPRIRTAIVLAATLALLVTGTMAGAAGDFLVLGTANDSGTSQTTLQNSGLGAAFTLKTTNASTNATGIFGWSSSTSGNPTRGVYGRADGPNSYGVYAAQNGASGSGSALFADGGANNAIVAESDSDTALIAEALGCSGFLCGRAGVHGIGVGLSGGVVGEGPLGVFGIDSLAGDGFGLFTSDDANVGGDLTVGGTCTGCATAATALNTSDATLEQGDAVKVLGVSTDEAGNILVNVGPATDGDVVFGIVASASTAVQSGTEDAPTTAYKDAGPSAAPGSPLKVVTSGIVAFAAADASGGAIQAGDPLRASSTAGSLSKAGPDSPATLTVGTALGTLEDGRVVIHLD